MANIVIDIDGIEGAERLLSRSFAPVMQTITLAVGELVRDEIATYPGPSSGPAKSSAASTLPCGARKTWAWSMTASVTACPSA